MDIGWKADKCKLQANHKSKECEETNLAQVETQAFGTQKAF